MSALRLLFRVLLGKRRPTISGTMSVPGLNHPVTVRRDRHGIPYINASNDEDALFGLGFCQGQDRSFQLEMIQRVVRGTLAELVGQDALPMDRLSRRIGFHRSAELQLAALNKLSQAILEAFAKGVNAGRSVGCKRRAHEFSILRARPGTYEAVDVIAMLKLMAFTLPANWDMELIRLKMLLEDGAEAVHVLEPSYPQWQPVSSPPGVSAGQALEKLAEDLQHLSKVAPLGGGSNKWALAASRTQTGRPILANDPHLPPFVPAHWYLAHVRTPEWGLVGASLVGTPAFGAGHNGSIAWGVTAGFVDNTDLFIEEIGPDGASVREGDRFVPCTVRVEKIKVKGKPDVEERVIETARGPIISPALEGELGAISLRATWLDTWANSDFLGLYRARNFEEFRSAFKDWFSLSQNMVFADATGDVGWQLVGISPRRKKGCGTIPLPGWDPDCGWHDDPIPFENMPYCLNPEMGFVATANTQPVPSGQGPFLGIDWLDGYRLSRIDAVLSGRSDWDLKSTRTMQMDSESVPWAELREIVLSVPPKSAEARQALDLLKRWDGVLSADSVPATVFEFFVCEMIDRVVRAKAPRSVDWAMGKSFASLAGSSMIAFRRVGHLVRLVREQPEGWFKRSWPEEMEDALATATKRLSKRFGSASSGWAWGQVRRLTLKHAFGDQRPLDKVFNLGPFPWGGDANTVSNASAPISQPTDNPIVIASLRMVLDVGNWDENTFSLPGGQSGNPLSPHYSDLLGYWKQGEGVPIPWSAEAVNRATESTLRLEPEGPA
jgi:penicillin amidase